MLLTNSFIWEEGQKHKEERVQQLYIVRRTLFIVHCSWKKERPALPVPGR